MILLARVMASRSTMEGRVKPGAAIERAQVLARQAFAHQVGDGLDGDAAGDFAGVVAAHAIGEH